MITRYKKVSGSPRAPRKPKSGRFSAVSFNLSNVAPIRESTGPKVFVSAAATLILASALWPTMRQDVPEDKPFLVDAEMLEPPKPPEIKPPEPPPPEPPKPAPKPATKPIEEKPPEPPPPQFGLDEDDLGEKSDMAVAMGNTVNTKADSVIPPPPPEIKPAEDPLKGKLVSVTRVTRMPTVRVATKPDYTPEMRQAGIAGKVKARLLVDSDGQVAKVEILQDIGYGTREASLRALKQVKFEPGTLDGTPVAVWIPFTFSYELHE